MSIDKAFNQVFSSKLKYYLSLYNMTQAELAKRLNVGTTSVSNWCKGLKSPRMDKVDAMCAIFNCKRSDLMEESADLTPITTIKVYGSVAAGVPIEMIEDVVGTEEIPEAMARRGEYFAVKIKGDSMEPRIYDGDIVIVRKTPDAESGSIVIVSVNGDDATCKRIVKYRDSIQLVSLNPKYMPKEFSAEEIEALPIRILGECVEVRGSLKY